MSVFLQESSELGIDVDDMASELFISVFVNVVAGKGRHFLAFFIKIAHFIQQGLVLACVFVNPMEIICLH